MESRENYFLAGGHIQEKREEKAPQYLKCRICGELVKRKTWNQLYCSKCADLGRKEYSRKYWQAIKLEVLTHYTPNGVLKCAFCNENSLSELSLDHLCFGKGNEERKKVGSVYLYLRRNNYPAGYRVLCLKCHTLLNKVYDYWNINTGF